MSHQLSRIIAMVIVMASATVAPAPVRASYAVKTLEISGAPVVVGDSRVPATHQPILDRCFTEYTGDGTTDFSSPDAQALRNALAAVAAGGTVKVAGTCAGAILEGGTTQVALVTTTLTLIGGYTPTDWANSYPLTQPTTLDALGTGRVLLITGVDGSVANLIAQDGIAMADDGGGIFATGALTLTEVTARNNVAARHGGGSFAGYTMTLVGGLYFNNTAGNSGGGLFHDYYGSSAATLRVSGTTFISNTAVSGGGGIYVTNQASIVGGLFQENRAFVGGGLQAVRLAMTGTQFISNTAGASGGGAFVYEYPSSIVGARFENNRALASDGGGLWAAGMPLIDTVFINNTAQRSGGGARIYGGLDLKGGLFQGNQALTCSGGGLYQRFTFSMSDVCINSTPNLVVQLRITYTQFISNTAARDGGGLYSDATATFSQVQVMGNTAQRNAGGVFALGAGVVDGGIFQGNRGVYGGGLSVVSAAAINGTLFLGNESQFYGGGAAFYGPATLTGGRFEGNWADTGGGGLSTAGSLALTGTQFIRNVSSVGGGLYQAVGDARLTNALFARNIASTTLGSAMYLSSTVGVDVIHTTIASPTLGGGSAIYVVAGTIRLTDTLISSYTVGISNGGGTVSENYTLFNGVTKPRAGAVGAGANSFTGTALFVNPAADDYQLGLGSAAINAGVNAGVFLDFEGTPRPFGGGFDIGYDEWGVPLRAYLPAAWR